MSRILCIEPDLALLESRCAVLKCSGFDACSASPHLAEVLLRSQTFDLLVVSSLNERDFHSVVNLSDSAEVLILDGITMPSELLALVTQRMNRHREA